MKKETIFLIIGCIGIFTFVFSWMAGYFKIHFLYFLVTSIVGGLVVFFIYRKATQEMTRDEANKMAILEMQKLHIPSPKILSITRHSDSGVFSSKGKLWHVLVRGNPEEMSILIDSKEKKVIGVDYDINNPKSLIKKHIFEKPRTVTRYVPIHKPSHYKREIKEESTPS